MITGPNINAHNNNNNGTLERNTQQLTLTAGQVTLSNRCHHPTLTVSIQSSPHKPDMPAHRDNHLCQPGRCGHAVLLRCAWRERHQLVRRTAAPAADASHCTAVTPLPTLAQQHTSIPHCQSARKCPQTQFVKTLSKANRFLSHQISKEILYVSTHKFSPHLKFWDKNSKVKHNDKIKLKNFHFFWH